MACHSLTAAGVVLAIMLAVSPALAGRLPTPTCNIDGATCASRPPSAQRACRNDWVEAQINATAIPGADCASRGPADYQTCINDWVKSQQARNGGAVGSTCGSLALQ
jgi:hypothetical protein